jgi:hypothetical protein
MGNNNDGRMLDNFEKASQEFFKESWELLWTTIGVVSLLVITAFGIYFSQVALAFVVGAVGVMIYFTYAASFSISALEVAGIKLLGNKGRSTSISESNQAEHKVATWFTYGLFMFDIITNWIGLYVTAIALSAKITFGAWVVIIFFGSLMAISEILVGWMIRAFATAYVSFLQAKKKFDAYKNSMERDINKDRQEPTYQYNYEEKQPHQNQNQPKNEEIPDFIRNMQENRMSRRH